jgi:hypothetical protein
VSADLFIGLVTHKATRFREAKQPEGLAATLVTSLKDLGLSCYLEIMDEDLLRDGEISFTPGGVRESMRAELQIEKQWKQYLREGNLSLKSRIMFSVRSWLRLLKYAPPWKSTLRSQDAGYRMIRRLANIELAHLALMASAVKSGAPWVLILEDDAKATDVEAFARDLLLLIRADESGLRELSMIHLSESFTPNEFGISHLLERIDQKSLPEQWTVFSSRKHLTNTVCAVLYRGEFLDALLTELQAIPLSPVIPIDFKINHALMNGASHLVGETWVCSPAPIAQASGVPRVVTGVD